MAMAKPTTTPALSEAPTRRGLLAAAFLATPAVLAAPVTLTPADDMAAWLDREAANAAERDRLVSAAHAEARAEGRNVIAAEDAVLEVTDATEAAHAETLPAMRIGTPQTARRALAWADCDRAGDRAAMLMRGAVDGFLAGLEA